MVFQDVTPERLMGVNNTEVPLTTNWTIWWGKLHPQNASSSRFCSHTLTGQPAQTNSLVRAESAKSTIPIHLFGGDGFSYGQPKTNNATLTGEIGPRNQFLERLNERRHYDVINPIKPIIFDMQISKTCKLST